jgi:hypothetical protein
MTKQSFVSIGLCAAAIAASIPAMADDAACLDAATKGQRLRATHKLVEARDKFRACAAAACPPVVQGDCAGWLGAVEKALPSVVLIAKNENGGSLIDVKVTVDGKPFATRLEGEAVPINPGPHTFHFEAGAGAVVEQVEVIPEGEQNHRLSVVFPKVPAPAQSVPAPSRPAATEEPAPTPAPRPAPSATTPSLPSGPTGSDTSSVSMSPDQGQDAGRGPWRAVGLVAGAVGIAGLGVGGVFGILTMNEHSSFESTPTDSTRNTGRLDGTVSTAAFVAGGVLLAGGAVLFFTAPSGSRRGSTSALLVAPSVGPGGGGLVLRGDF